MNLFCNNDDAPLSPVSVLAFVTKPIHDLFARGALVTDLNEDIEEYLKKEMEQVPAPAALPQYSPEIPTCGNQHEPLTPTPAASVVESKKDWYWVCPLESDRYLYSFQTDLDTINEDDVFSKPTLLMTIFEYEELEEEKRIPEREVLETEVDWMKFFPQRGHRRSVNVLMRIHLTSSERVER